MVFDSCSTDFILFFPPLKESLSKVSSQTFVLLFYKPLVLQLLYFVFNPLQDDKILHWSNLKQIADDILIYYQTTNFGLFQTEKVCRGTISNLTEMEESYPNT